MNEETMIKRGSDAAARFDAIVYITQNVEFVVVNGICTMARDRATGEFLEDHHSVHERVSVEGCGPARRLSIHTMGLNISSAAIERTRRLSAAERSYAKQSRYAA